MINIDKLNTNLIKVEEKDGITLLITQFYYLETTRNIVLFMDEYDNITDGGDCIDILLNMAYDKSDMYDYIRHLAKQFNVEISNDAIGIKKVKDVNDALPHLLSAIIVIYNKTFMYLRDKAEEYAIEDIEG